jgi:Endonuclease/Exonuclease/phosphatase family
MPAIFDSSYTSRMRIATWNVNGLRARATQLRAWLERERPDLVCLQELKAEERQIPDDCKLGDYHAFWHCRKAHSGVALLVRKDGAASVPVFTHSPFDVQSRALLRYVHWLRAVTSTGSMPWIARRPVGLQRLEASWKCWRFWSRRSDLNR